MTDIIVRLGVLVLLTILLGLLVWCGRQFVELQRKRALTAPLPDSLAPTGEQGHESQVVRILAFSSPDCKQCHQLQTPAITRVQEIYGEQVTVVQIDAPSTPELVHQYHVLTVPTTVILDPTGHAQAVNYGFANTQRLLEQVDAALTPTPQTIS